MHPMVYVIAFFFVIGFCMSIFGDKPVFDALLIFVVICVSIVLHLMSSQLEARNRRGRRTGQYPVRDFKYTFPDSNHINKKLLTERHQSVALAFGQNNSSTSRSVPFPKPSTVVKRELLPKNNLNIRQLMEGMDGKSAIIGKFFLCRVLLEPVKLDALTTIVDDPVGEHALRLTIFDYHQDTHLPVGTILAIQDPWLFISSDGGMSLKVDNRDDAMALDSATLKELKLDVAWNHGEIPGLLIPDGIDYTKKGNDHFIAHEYLEAIASYSIGIATSHLRKTRTELFSSRSFTYLKLEKYELSLQDSNSVLELDPQCLKAHCRKVKALFGLKKYKEALEFVSKVTVKTFKKVQMTPLGNEMLDKLVKETHLNYNNFKARE